MKPLSVITALVAAALLVALVWLFATADIDWSDNSGYCSAHPNNSSACN